MTVNLLNQAAISGTSYEKAVHIGINNDDQNPTITYIEAVNVVASDGTISRRNTGRSPITRPINLSEAITFVAGPNVGKTFTMEELYTMVASCYFKHHAEDAARLAADKAAAATLMAKLNGLTQATTPPTTPTV